MSNINTSVVKEIKLTAKPSQFFIQSALTAFNKQEAGESVTDEELDLIKSQTDLVLDGFGLSSMEDTVELSLKMEDFIFDLFQLIPEPSAPLRNAAHKKYIMGIAQSLSSTIDKPDSMITLSDEDLDKVKKFIDTDEEFDKLQVKFQYVRKVKTNSGEAGEISSIPLNPKLLTVSPAFVQTLSALFKQS